MKKNSSILLAAIATVAVWGCTKNPVVPENGVSLENLGEEKVTVAASGEDVVLSFKSSAAWTAKASEEWLFVGQESGAEGFQDVEVSVEPNETGEARNAVVIVKIDDEHSFSVLVNQLQNDIFGVSDKVLNIAADGGELSFTVSGNVAFELSCSEDWIEVVESKAVVDSKVVLNIAENFGEERIGTVKVSSVAGELSVRIVEAGSVSETIGGAEAYYYGDYYGEGTANWSILFLNDAFLNYDFESDWLVYAVDLIVDAKYDFLYVEEHGLPDGTYVLDDSCLPGTIGADTQIINYLTGEALDVEDAKFVIDEGVFSLTVTTVDGVTCKWSWEADPEMLFYTDKSYESTVEKDYEVTFDECEITPIGQYFEGVETYQTLISFAGGNPQLGEEDVADGTEGMVLLSTATPEFAGSYTVHASQDFAAGSADAYNCFFYSYLGQEYLSDGYFRVGGGSLTVTKDGDEYVIEGVFTDDIPEYVGATHQLTIHARGVVVEDGGSPYASCAAKTLGRKSPLGVSLREVKNPAGRYAIRF